MKKNISDEIRQLRKKKGLSTEELASILNIEQIEYEKYECGLLVPSYEMLSKIANECGVETAYFYTRNNVNTFKIMSLTFNIITMLLSLGLFCIISVYPAVFINQVTLNTHIASIFDLCDMYNLGLVFVLIFLALIIESAYLCCKQNISSKYLVISSVIKLAVMTALSVIFIIYLVMLSNTYRSYKISAIEISFIVILMSNWFVIVLNSIFQTLADK